MSYPIETHALVEIVVIFNQPVVVVCSMFSFFKQICAQISSFPDVFLNNHIEEESYRWIGAERNCAIVLSNGKKV